ncbi:MAG: hypothetical protein JSW71_15415 [Gemmatimonadota bacterium]|nr:MAG: hypothetical protein JSW71_15415 [Gemmatimonadota bacterium]
MGTRVAHRVIAYMLAVVTAVATVPPGPLCAQDTLAAPTAGDLPPAGYGTLGQEDISITLIGSDFTVGLIPLDEGVIRLLRPDTYNSMRRLRQSKDDEIDRVARDYGIREPAIFFVSFFGKGPQARFNPEALTITGQNRSFRPVAILANSRAFSDRQLNQRETATAIYIYEDGIRLADPFTLSYEGDSSNQWEVILRTLERERAAAEARAAALKKPRIPA